MTDNNQINIGCIGLGNMGKAVMTGLSGKYSPENLSGYDICNTQINSLSSNLTILASPNEVAKKADIIILAVKPNIILETAKQIEKDIEQSIIISIAAGVTIQSIENVIGTDKKIVRAMPNTPALIGEGVTVLAPNNNISENKINIIKDIFNLLGKTLILPEKNFDAVTALSGCGPAYVFSFIQAMADAGVKLGLNRTDATLLASQTIKGASSMQIQSQDDPISLRGKVTSPGGATIAAIHKLEKAGFNGIIMDAIEEAAHVSKKLGDKK